MELQTYSNIKTKLQNDLDIEDLDFLNGEEELLGYINEAIDDAESMIHTLGLQAQYFLTQGTITLASGTADYSLPSDIFGHKIKAMFYINGNTKYEIFRVRDIRKTPYFQSGDDYQYLPLTTSATANNFRVRFFPTPAESGAYVQIWYIRNITKMTSAGGATNVCEVPEAINFIYQHVKMRVYEKQGNPLLVHAKEMLRIQRDLMLETLQEMVPDENSVIEPDTSFYEDCELTGLRRD